MYTNYSAHAERKHWLIDDIIMMVKATAKVMGIISMYANKVFENDLN